MKKFFTLMLFLLLLTSCGQSVTNEAKTNQNDAGQIGEGTNTGEETKDNEASEETKGTEEKDNEPALSENHHPVYLYFSDTELNDIYSVETTVSGSSEEVFVNTLKAWIKGPEEEQLTSLIPNNVEILSFEDDNGVARISFSKEILNANLGSTGEYMLTQQIALLMKQFGFHSTQILVEGKTKETLFGHVETSRPIQPELIDQVKTLE